MQQRDFSQQYQKFYEEFDKAMSDSHKRIIETNTLLQKLGSTPVEGSKLPRVFSAKKYSPTEYGFKYRFFVEEMKSAQDAQKNGKAVSYTTNSIKHFFFSASTNAVGCLHELSPQHSITMAVIGGNHFRRMLGSDFAKYYLAVDETNVESHRHYRIAKAVNEFIDWTEYQNLKPAFPIYGLFVNVILAYYFYDFDITLNFGFTEGNEFYKVSKIDPEHSYSDLFTEETEEDILEHLNFIFNSSTTYEPERIAQYRTMDNDEQKVFMIYGHTTPNFFQIALDSAPFLDVELFQRLFFSPQRNRELFIALSIILDTYPSELRKDVDDVLGPENSTFKSAIFHYQNKRYENFKSAAFRLNGFAEYYLTKSYVNDIIYRVYKNMNPDALHRVSQHELNRGKEDMSESKADDRSSNHLAPIWALK